MCRCSYLALASEDNRVLCHAFRQCRRLINRIKVYKLSFPREYRDAFSTILMPPLSKMFSLNLLNKPERFYVFILENLENGE